MNAIIKHTTDTAPADMIIRAGYESLSPKTRRAYTADLDSFYQIVGKDIREITPLDILTYIEVLDRSEAKNSTINRKLYSLSKVFNLYLAAGVIEKNPVTELNRVKKITRGVSRQVPGQLEIADIVAVVAIGSRTAVVINALANTGMRISELIGIKHGNIEAYRTGGQDYKRIRIEGKGRKERFIFLSDKLYAEIVKVFPGESEYLFHSDTGRALNRANLYKQIKQTFKAHTGKDIHPHSLRHFFATHKINSEKQDIKAVSRYLGHSGTAITLDMYVDTALDADCCMIKGLTS